MVYRSITSFILLLFSLSLFAQHGIIKGRVLDSKNKEAIIGASVVADSSGGVTSDITGNYELKPSPGEHQIFFSFLGYKTQTITATVFENERPERDILW